MLSECKLKQLSPEQQYQSAEGCSYKLFNYYY